MSIRNVVITLLAILAAETGIAQTEMTITRSGNEFAAKLIAEKVDTMITYNYPDYRSEPWEHAYIIWKKEGKTQVYIDHTKETLPVDDSAAARVWKFLDTNLKIIKTEKVKPFSSMIQVKGKDKDKDKVETIPTMDPEWWKCRIYMKGDITKISEGESAFHKKSTDVNGKVKMNINYEYNSKLKRKVFLNMLGELVPE